MTFKPRTELSRALYACRAAGLIVVAFSFGINVLTLASPLYMLHLYDHVLSSRSIDTLIMLTLMTAFALAALSVLDALRSQVLARVGLWLDDRLTPPVMTAGLKMALAGGPMRATDALRDLQTLRGFLAGPTVAPFMDAPWAPLFLITLFLLHPVLGVIGVVSAAILFGLAVLNELVTRTPLREANAAAARSYSSLDAAFRNAEVIEAMGMLNGVLRLWRAESREGKDAQGVAARRGAMVLASSRFVRLMVQSGIMGAGAWLVIVDNASPGIMFGSTFLLARALAPVENAISTWKSVVAVRLSYQRLRRLFETAPATPKGMDLPRPEGRLVLDRATFGLSGTESPILRGVSFALAPGEMLGIIGPSAAGKSTLARLIAGAWRPTSGHVRLDNADIAVWLASGGARHIGYLPQDVELFGRTVSENIARLGDVSAEAVIAAAQLAGLHENIMLLPKAYDTEIGDGGVKLSGGQRQRVALARAPARRPRARPLRRSAARHPRRAEFKPRP